MHRGDAAGHAEQVAEAERHLRTAQDAVADHFRSHIDAGPSHSTRKLSFSLQLTDGATYQGGDLIFGDRLADGYRNQGSLVIFPSVSLHEVTPVFRGIRHTIVGWIHGPTLR